MSYVYSNSELYELIRQNLDNIFSSSSPYAEILIGNGHYNIYRSILEKELEKRLTKIKKDNDKRRIANRDIRKKFLAVVIPRFLKILNNAPEFGYTATDIQNIYIDKYEESGVCIDDKTFIISPGCISNILNTEIKDIVVFGYNNERRRTYKLR